MRVFGVSAYCHDAAALVVDGESSAAAQEDRFTRIEHAPAFTVHAIRVCLDMVGLRPRPRPRPRDLDFVTFYDRTLLKFERLPFAPSVLREDVAARFELDAENPCMLLVAPVGEAHRPAMSDAQAALVDIAKLNAACSSIPAVTHVDQPIVCAPEDASRCFMGTHIDVLAVGNCFLRKADQPVALATRYAAGFSLD